MEKTTKITVHPAAIGTPELTVRDAMSQVLDFVELLESASEMESEAKINWILKSASTNSPLTIELEGLSNDPQISVELGAIHAQAMVVGALACLADGGVVPIWMDTPSLKIAKRIFERNMNGVGRTDLHIPSDENSISINPASAQVGLLTIEKALLENKLGMENLTRTEYGAVEATIVTVQTYHGKPALVLRDWLAGNRIICVLSEEAARQIGPEHNLDDVWEGRRVYVTGDLHYGASGNLERIDASNVEHVEFEEISLAEMRSLDITDGRSPIDHIKLMREHEHG